MIRPQVHGRLYISNRKIDNVDRYISHFMFEVSNKIFVIGQDSDICLVEFFCLENIY